MKDRGPTISIRVAPELKARLERAAVSRHPYQITMTSIVERGIELACLELELEKEVQEAKGAS